ANKDGDLGTPSEAFAAPGDSGGPLLLQPAANGPLQIAGVMVSIRTPGKPVDIRDYVDSKGKPQPDSSFGEIGIVTRVKSFVDNFIKPATAGKYNIVLDMNQQLLGRDGIKENLTIKATVEKNAAGIDELVISVTGSAAAAYNGEYFRQPLANIK